VSDLPPAPCEVELGPSRATDGFITNPTNLYSHAHFPSLDFTLSFHVGVTERVYARQAPSVPTEEGRRLASAWRTWRQAAEALDHADEAEEFQAIGVRCRDALLDFIAATSKPEMIPAGQEAPKRGDFLRWVDLVGNAIAPGKSAERVRQYLKTVAEETWQLVGWLTHAQNAAWPDTQLAVDATQNVLAAFGAIAMKAERRNAVRVALPIGSPSTTAPTWTPKFRCARRADGRCSRLVSSALARYYAQP
jgi:hypothetical protein